MVQDWDIRPIRLPRTTNRKKYIYGLPIGVISNNFQYDLQVLAVVIHYD